MGVLELFDSIEWLTIGLLIFAGVQILVPHLAERRRISERQADDERASDVAFQTAWAEHFRIDGLADEYERLDLLQLAALGVLNPDDVLPRDWSVVMSALARLGPEAGYLGGVALTLGHDTARNIATLNALIKNFQRMYPNEGAERIAELVRNNRKREVDELEKKIRQMTRDLGLLMFDAVRQSPRADVHRIMNFRDDMRSQFGKTAVKAIKEREQKAQLPEPSPRLLSKVLARLKGRSSPG